MKATEVRLLNFLGKSNQFIIPIYQRTYRWTARQCQQLWDDIINAGRTDNIAGHFVGSIVYVEEGLFNVSSIPQLLVIDGQQRLTTISLIIAALSRALEGTAGVEEMTTTKLTHYYLLNPLEEGDKRFKLQLTQTDKLTLHRIIENKPLPAEHSVRVVENFDYFRKQMPSTIEELAIVYRGISKLLVVDISLDRSHDNPQLIFESLNSTGLDLSQADLIRNYVLMGLEPGHQRRLYEEHWHPMEQSFGQEEYARLFDRFMRDYLTVKTGTIPNIAAVYEAFKTYSGKDSSGGVDVVVGDVHRMSDYFVAIALARETDREIAAALADINVLKVDVAYPFLLELYDDYMAGQVTRSEVISAMRLVESYVFRRAVCGIPTNSLNKTFTTLADEIKKDHYVESLQAAFQLMPGYRRFPDDDEFARELQVKDLYNFRSRNYWLRKMENHGRREYVPVEEYTIEHIMPQNENLSARWKTDLGPDWQGVHARYLHTIGNLTLTGYNSELSDRPFLDKRDHVGGFARSPLRLNQGLGQLERWDEQSICARAEELAKLACDVWPFPGLSEEKLAPYRPTPQASRYTLANHPHLNGAMLYLFEEFRKQVLNLDAAVSEDILRTYIAFKAPGNFVDVIPQSVRLCLVFNLAFDEMNDPKGMCLDRTGTNHWGNGDVEVFFNHRGQLPYIIGLVQQSLDKQLGNGNSQ